MVLLDTTVISQFTKVRPNPAIVEWLEETRAEDLYLSVITLFELRVGIEMMDAGRRRDTLSRWLKEDVPREYGDRLLPVTPRVAARAARIVSDLKRMGRNDLEMDALIAATAQTHNLEVATLNRRDFELMNVTLVDF